MRQHLIALAILLGVVTRFAAAQAPPTAGAVADAFVRAWNTHDARAFGRLFAEDGDWVTVAGATHKGRPAIEGVLKKEHESWARMTTLRAMDIVVREINADHAIVMFKWEITRANEPDATPMRGNSLLVAAKEHGGWIIIAGQAAVPLAR